MEECAEDVSKFIFAIYLTRKLCLQIQNHTSAYKCTLKQRVHQHEAQNGNYVPMYKLGSRTARRHKKACYSA